ncbi:MAG TPA: hypothetical protein VFI56_26395 [Vicinamibacterales bacterium]|nr:hypothetical protein [Vicinamibacterales bacterium]
MRFRSDNGLWLTAELGGGINGDSARGPARPDALISDRTDDDVKQFGFAWQDFTLITNDDKTVSLQIGKWFVTAERGGGSAVSTDRDVNGPWQRFTMQTSNGAAQFLCSDGVHYLKLRTDLERPYVDATGTTQGSRFRLMDPVPVVAPPPVVVTTTTTSQSPGSVRTTFSKAQLVDIQTNLMLFIGDVPELAPHFDASGYDPVLRIRNQGDNGATPHGIVSGQWMWTTTLPNYPETLWPKLFAQARRFGATHWFLHVAALPVGGGYHGLYPVDAAFAAGNGNRLNRAHAALLANGLIPVCAGVAPDAPPAPGFDCSQVLVAMTDWDNSEEADSRINAIAAAFPRAMLYYERPGPNPRVSPKPDAASQVAPTETNGGAWLRSVQQRCPNFQGVIYEVNIWEGLQGCIDEITRCHPFYRDVQEVRGETNTYELFWQGGDPQKFIALDDQLQAACPWLRGYISGGTPHQAPTDQPTSTKTGLVSGDAFDFTRAVQHRGTPFTDWPATTEITRLEMRSTGVHVEFAKRDGPGRWPDVTPTGWDGPLQFCLGIAMLIDGTWHVTAPIQFWFGLDATGGNIGDPSPRDNGLAGTIHGDWCYSGEWGPMQRQPAAGERVGFFVVAGNVRGVDDVVSVRERSNVVVVPFPDAHGAVFSR